ncbi:peroxisomal membrane anchor protein conserved region-domain-containing protein [Daldinia caldariorum]|uniref:peroxisomal membrane anchor protein conserved region-domain-containing protein n=1 Tax=Daldinia caldariorum TaxID=326644 RepID=UPI00200807AC|nr:peroxisomal membrane anchor protein conserved region-domain-containing protein [Daldinia caldariorum]KAI1471968.1 peroxisomal membrane anchor protein conserved region-domain-containing protein [Daldinia caldariorum]
MADPKQKIPSWQHAQYEATKEAPETSESQEDVTVAADKTDAVTLDQVRKFLKDDTVRNSSVEKKREFLKGKGLDDAQIQQLLDEIDEQDAAQSTSSLSSPINTPTSSMSSLNDDNEQTSEKEVVEESTDRYIERAVQPTSSSAANNNNNNNNNSNVAPIITYPEFLTAPPKPEPLITPSRLGNILAVTGGIWTLLYGVSRFGVNPMVNALNDSRADYFAHVGSRLSRLVEKLEDTVSEVPYHNNNGKPLLSSRLRGNDGKERGEEGDDDDESTFSDPTEMFHRDVGTQTSPVMQTAEFGSSTSSLADRPIDAQARRLTALRASLREMSDMHVRHAEGAADLNALLREVRDEVDKLGVPPMLDFSAVYGGFGYGRNSGSGEVNDEVKKTKDAIRSVKGMFLSSRSFPTTTAR